MGCHGPEGSGLNKGCSHLKIRVFWRSAHDRATRRGRSDWSGNCNGWVSVDEEGSVTARARACQSGHTGGLGQMRAQGQGLWEDQGLRHPWRIRCHGGSGPMEGCDSRPFRRSGPTIVVSAPSRVQGPRYTPKGIPPRLPLHSPAARARSGTGTAGCSRPGPGPGPGPGSDPARSPPSSRTCRSQCRCRTFPGPSPGDVGENYGCFTLGSHWVTRGCCFYF